MQLLNNSYWRKVDIGRTQKRGFHRFSGGQFAGVTFVYSRSENPSSFWN